MCLISTVVLNCTSFQLFCLAICVLNDSLFIMSLLSLNLVHTLLQVYSSQKNELAKTILAV